MGGRLLKPHVFVAMPFQTKKAADGRMIDFDAVYSTLFAPALKDEFHVFRADQEERSGNIAADMFQELLLADLVLVDISIDNPNVWYELGVRHALRARGIVLVRGLDRRPPFDITQERIFAYGLDDSDPRRPDPARLEADRLDLSNKIQATFGSWRGRKESPVYRFLPALTEPDWRSLKVGDLAEFWEQLSGFEDLVQVAKSKKRPGDILLVADEMPNHVLQLEALGKAGQALNDLGSFAFALTTLDRGLELDETDIFLRQQRALALGRLGQRERAQQELRRLAEDDRSGETLGLLGRVYKDIWTNAFDQPGQPRDADLRDAAARQEGRLLESAKAYQAAFYESPTDYYPGINALTLSRVWSDLTGLSSKDECLDVEGLTKGVEWAVHCALRADRQDYWALSTDAELALMNADADETSIIRCYRKAAQTSQATWFKIDSSRQQVVFLRQLGWRISVCDAVLDLLDAEIEHHQPVFVPRQVVLFAGHMVDREGRATPRFPAAKVEAAGDQIVQALEGLGVGPEDLAMSGAACGGDLLFLKAARDLGLKATVHLPKKEHEFLAESVSFAGAEWAERYARIKEDSEVTLRILPVEVGPTPESVNAHARNSLWLLYSALAHGFDKLSVVLLWDRQGGDGPGGTAHMAAEVERLTGRAARIIDVADL